MLTNPADLNGPADNAPRAGGETAGPYEPPPLPPVPPVWVVGRWVCCHCAGTGLTWDGQTCPDCCGNGHC